MTAKRKGCTVEIEIDQQGASETFTSTAMHDLVEIKAKELVKKKAELAQSHVHSMPRNGLYGYRMKKGRNTWMAVINPTSSAGYYIGRKYGTY